MLSLSLAGAPDGELTLATLIESLAARQTGELAFVETRDSSLLDEPMEVTGTLSRNSDGALVREITDPYRETHWLTEEHVEIRQPSGYRKRFSLGRAPELAALRHALNAVLDGDAAALEAHFESQLRAEAEEGDTLWELSLSPIDESLAERVDRIVLSGRDDQLELILMHLPDDESVRTRVRPNP